MIKSGSSLVFPNFDDIKVSTKTFTATTNLNIQIDKLYQKLPITPYIVTLKKRGRKKKCENIDHNKSIEPGSIITVKYENELRGVELKPKKVKTGKKRKWFRNSITVVIILDKPIKALSSYKVQDLIDICNKLVIDIVNKETGKNKTKNELYESIIQYF